MNLSQVKTDEDLVFLGYKCIGLFCEMPGNKHKGFNERLWYWAKDNGEHVVAYDMGNSYLKLIEDGDYYTDWLDELSTEIARSGNLKKGGR